MADLNFRELTETAPSENENRKRKLSGDGDGGDSKMMKETDNTARDKVFENKMLMGKMIGYAMPLNHESRLAEEVRYRLVNKTFNQAVLRSFRENFRDISIGMTDNGKIVLNKCCMHRKRLRGFGVFLKYAAKVEFHVIRVIRVANYALLDFVSHLMGMVANNYEKLEVFTGLDLLKPEDEEKSARIAVRCREYGPLQLDVLLNAFRERTHHYDTLIVSEYLLEKIAIQCAESAVDKDDCLARMAAIITPNITCRRLVLKLYEKPERSGWRWDDDSDYDSDDWDDRDDSDEWDEWDDSYGSYGSDDWDHDDFDYASMNRTQSLPREIIDEMIRKWNVKSVKLEFHSNTIRPIVSSRWSKFGYFTQIRFDQPYVDMGLSSNAMDLVEVDLENAREMLMAIADEKYRRKNDKSYENLFANVRRVFPTKEMIVRFSMTFEFCHKRPGKTTEMIKNIINSVWIDNPKNLNMKIDMFSYRDPAFNSHQIPSHFRLRILETRMTVNDCHVKELGDWRDFEKYKLRSAREKRYSIVDGINKCQIDFGVFERMFKVSIVDERRGKMIFECRESDTIGDLKKKIAASVCRSSDEFVLKAKHKVLYDHSTLLEFNVYKIFELKIRYL